VQILGYELSFRKALPLRPLSSGRDGWWPIIREPYTGAWQANDELRTDSVLTHPAVFRCVSLIATDIGKCRLRLVAIDDDGIWTETTSPAFSPVLRNPNRYQTPPQFVEAWITSKLLWGNTYVYKEREGRGLVRALYVLDPARVTPLVGPDGSVYYELKVNELAGLTADEGGRLVVPAAEIIHDRWNCLFHPLVGIPPLYACGGAAVQGLKMQEHSTAFFANGSQPAGLILVPGAISEEQVSRLKTQWQTAHGGLNRGGTGLLTHGMTYQGIGQSAVDAQLTEQLGWSAKTIAGTFGVPVSMIDSSQQPPYANSEASTLQYRSQCLQTLMTGLETCLDAGLELPPPYGTEFDIDDLVWMDTATKTNAAHEAIGCGAMAPNEARAKYFGLGPVAGGETPYLQQQYIPLRAAAEPKPTPPPPPAPAPADEDEDVEKVPA
jgi:HK97 family phage portal protein